MCCCCWFFFVCAGENVISESVVRKSERFSFKKSRVVLKVGGGVCLPPLWKSKKRLLGFDGDGRCVDVGGSEVGFVDEGGGGRAKLFVDLVDLGDELRGEFVDFEGLDGVVALADGGGAGDDGGVVGAGVGPGVGELDGLEAPLFGEGLVFLGRSSGVGVVVASLEVGLGVVAGEVQGTVAGVLRVVVLGREDASCESAVGKADDSEFQSGFQDVVFVGAVI
mmetsp:Transcript_14102/g.46039  ORF Transcript_14102/g.46039 Transcript_14102/m.46039 type:complete len:222 (+) Transcript_14102:249-914(+)